MRSILILVAPLLLGACGDCPPSRYRPARPESTATYAYQVQSDGTIDYTVDGVAADPLSCHPAAACHTVFENPDMSCATACAILLSGSYAVTDCAFDPTLTALRCDMHQAAQDEQCNCSIIDC